MKYVNADNIFPKELLQEIRQYMPEGYVYISPQNGRKEWGSISGQKEELGKRNAQIYEEYQSGKSVAMISKERYLSKERQEKNLPGKDVKRDGKIRQIFMSMLCLDGVLI